MAKITGIGGVFLKCKGDRATDIARKAGNGFSADVLAADILRTLALSRDDLEQP